MHHGNTQEAQSLQNDGFSFSAQGDEVLHSSLNVPLQDAIAHIRDFFEQEDQDAASLSSFGELFSFHTKASEFAAVLKEDSPALNFNWSSPIDSRVQTLLMQPQEDDVNGGTKHDEAQKIGSALKPRKDFSIGKPRFHKYADGTISKLRYYDEYIDMKICKGRLPMYFELHDMLVQCASVVCLNDTNTAKAIAWKVKQLTSPYGSAAERLAHYFVKALYARFAGTGWSLYRGHLDEHRPSFTQILEAKMKIISSCPFTQASHLFSNETILRVAKGASKLVIFEHQMSGIQYPSLFKKLAALPGGPPTVSLIAHNVPHYSMLPAQTDVIFAALEEVGQRLSKCAALFMVPFHFTPWFGTRGKIHLQDFVSSKRLPGEVFVAISTSFLRFVTDDILDPRPIRLKSFKKLCDTCPDVFIKGAVSGAYSTPFYSTRFKEALSYFACIFDVLDTFIGRNNKDRLVFESEVLGKAILNVVACEGLPVSERVEKYKQWQAVIEEAGMQQLALNANIVHQMESLLKSWHKDYMIIEDRQNLLLGWRGRTLYALSTWKSPASSWAMPS
ncbi:hypothetical protein GOP47_0022779 [Adiantum capillus-veneris]|uniref:Uncharacterized protein n=1 Tax=Adiantum capillus-veneris TaxID=13818 RepID=A0A9D4U6H4_ADICA|nr:hypothetical protein GOP47_0022779 [Adiantum capillus-veneris]